MKQPYTVLIITGIPFPVKDREMAVWKGNRK